MKKMQKFHLQRYQFTSVFMCISLSCIHVAESCTEKICMRYQCCVSRVYREQLFSLCPCRARAEKLSAWYEQSLRPVPHQAGAIGVRLLSEEFDS